MMIWEMISADGPVPLVRLHGEVNAEVYKQLLLQPFFSEPRRHTFAASNFHAR